MKTAAETYDQLMTLLNPQFEAFTSAIKDLKKDLDVINAKLEEIHDKAVSTADAVAHLEEQVRDHEYRLKAVEDMCRDNLNGVGEFKHFRALAYSALGGAVVTIISVAIWVAGIFVDNARHEESMKAREAADARYSDIVKRLESLDKAHEVPNK